MVAIGDLVSVPYPICVFDSSTLGTLVELMVRAEILAGSGGRLIPSRVEPDAAHRDLVIAEVAGYGAVWLQVKATTHPDAQGRIVPFPNYPSNSTPQNALRL